MHVVLLRERNAILRSQPGHSEDVKVPIKLWPPQTLPICNASSAPFVKCHGAVTAPLLKSITKTRTSPSGFCFENGGHHLNELFLRVVSHEEHARRDCGTKHSGPLRAGTLRLIPQCSGKRAFRSSAASWKNSPTHCRSGAALMPVSADAPRAALPFS